MSASKIIGTSFDMTIVDGRSSQTKIIKSNMHLTDLYLEVPVLATAKKTAKLVITTERGNTIFAVNELDASSAKTYPIRLSKSLMGAITLEITTDATVTGDKTFTIELRGYGWVVSDSADQDGYYYAKLGSTNLYGLEHPSFRITEELNKIPSFEFEIANCSDNRTAIAAGITDVFRIYRRIYSVDTLMFTGIINGDAIEYLSLERIRITGYASYIDLNWRFHQHLNSEDAENVNAVYKHFESYGGYAYSKLCTVIATTAGAQTNYQLELKVGESSGASGADVHCESHCVDFPNDIRYTKEDGVTKHDYWVDASTLEGTTPNRKVSVWIEVASVPASGTVDFYMYYGKNADAGGSNGDNTFEFFDDVTTYNQERHQVEAHVNTPAITKLSSGHLLLTYYHAADKWIKVYKSTNNGDSWSLLSTPHASDNSHPDITSVGNNTVWIVSRSSLHVWTKKSTNGGATWSGTVTVRSSTGIYDTAILYVNSNLLLIAIANNPASPKELEIYKSINEGSSWTFVTNAITGTITYEDLNLVKAPNGDIVLTYEKEWAEAGHSGVYCVRSTDNGATWGSEITILDNGTADNEGGTVLVDGSDMYQFVPTDEDKGSGSYKENNIKRMKSIDNGATWSDKTLVMDTKFTVEPCVVKTSTGKVLFFGVRQFSDVEEYIFQVEIDMTTPKLFSTKWTQDQGLVYSLLDGSNKTLAVEGRWLAGKKGFIVNSLNQADCIIEYSGKGMGTTFDTRSVFRYTDINNHYLADHTPTAMEFYKRVGGTYTQLDTDAPVGVVDMWYDYKIQVLGANIKTWVDGLASNDKNDSAHTTGKTGLSCHQTEVRNPVLFKDYRVRKYVSPEPTWGTWGGEQTPDYTDYTTAANNDAINDVLPGFGTVGDILLVGQNEQFFGIQIKYSTKGVQAASTTVVFEYSKGSDVWATLDLLDETRAFTEAPGTYYITIPHKPDDWAKETVYGAKKFWIRARLSVGSYTTPPKLDRIKMTNTDVYRVYYFDTAADTIIDEVLAGTGYSMDITDACPSDTISIVAEYETKLRIVAGIANALTWDDSGDKKGYQWWIDTSEKVHFKQKRGATLGDITGELTILNNIGDYFNLSNRLHFFGNYDGLNQLRAVIENIDSQDTHEIRELAVPEERYNNYIPLKEAAQKAMTYTKAPLQKIAATVTTKYWLDNSFEVGDTVTLHATSWDVASQAFQIVRADIGARVTNLDIGISQEHLDALKAGLQRQLDISGIRMHGSTTLLQFGPETMNYQRVDGSTVYPAHLKFEIPSDARYIHKVLVSWKLGAYRADITSGTESEGHDHDGYAGAGGDFTPEVEDGGAHTPTEIGTGSHDHTLDLVLVKTSRAGYLVSQKYVYSSPDHTHPKGVTSLPDDTGDAIVGVVFGDSCESVGYCVDYVSWDTFAENTHQHLNYGLDTGAAGLHEHNLYTATTVKEDYIYGVSIGTNTASTDPDHTHTINEVTAHPHTGVYHDAHNDHVIVTASASDVDLELGIIEVPGGTVMQLTVNGEDVTTVNGNGTDIVITGYCNTGSNTVELYPVVGSNTKGGATTEGRGILFIEAAKF